MAVTFEQLGAETVKPVATLLNSLVEALPGIVGGIVVLFVGYVVALFVATVVRKGLRRLRFNKWVVQKTGLKEVAGDIRATELTCLLVKWSVFALFFAPAANLFALDPLTGLLSSLAAYIPKAIVALLFVLFGLIMAEYVAQVIMHTRVKGVKLFADAAKVLVLLVTAIIALQQLELEVGVLADSFVTILQGVVFGLSLAFGLSFGMGGKQEAARLIKKAKRRF